MFFQSGIFTYRLRRIICDPIFLVKSFYDGPPADKLNNLAGKFLPIKNEVYAQIHPGKRPVIHVGRQANFFHGSGKFFLHPVEGTVITQHDTKVMCFGIDQLSRVDYQFDYIPFIEPR